MGTRATTTMTLQQVCAIEPSKKPWRFWKSRGVSTQQEQEPANHKNVLKMDSGMLLKAETLRRCVMETFRFTAHPIGGIRRALRPFVLEAASGRKYTILKGDTIAISHIAPHLNRKLWGDDADQFRLDRPEYDVDKNTSTSAKNKRKGASCPSLEFPVDDGKLTKFSRGIHKCPGEKFALALAEMVLAHLLVRDAEIDSSSSLLSEFNNGATGGQIGKKRLPPLLYAGSTLTQRKGLVPIKITTCGKV